MSRRVLLLFTPTQLTKLHTLSTRVDRRLTVLSASTFYCIVPKPDHHCFSAHQPHSPISILYTVYLIPNSYFLSSHPQYAFHPFALSCCHPRPHGHRRAGLYSIPVRHCQVTSQVLVNISFRGARLSRLPARAIVGQLCERDVYDTYERDLENFNERNLDNLYERSPPDLYGKLLDTRSDDEPSSPRRASRCSRSPSPTRGYVAVDMDEAKLIPRGRGGIETTGVCGCTAVGIVGSRGLVVAHVGPADEASIRKLGDLALQVSSPAESVIYAPMERGQIMDPKEVDNIKRALGDIVPTVIPYAYVEGGHMKVLSISGAGQICWR